MRNSRTEAASRPTGKCFGAKSRATIRSRRRHAQVHMHSNTSVGTDGEKIYEFSQEAYTELYGGRVSTPGTVIREVERGDLRDLRSGDWYLYIVAEMDQLVIHNEPMSLTELIASRTVTEDGPLPVIHPTLAERYGFRVKAAGEFSPVIAEGGAVVGVVVNSKSGHFCPAPQTLNVACRAFARVAPDARIVPVAVRLRLTD